MKINSLVAKTALAAAIAGASFAVSAKTIDLGVGGTGPVVLANEIFGNNSNTTIVQLPELVFNAKAAPAGKPALFMKLTHK